MHNAVQPAWCDCQTREKGNFSINLTCDYYGNTWIKTSVKKQCYACGADATSDEHIPPKCMFPEKDEFEIDFKKNLITVPSCEKHNQEKGMDDEFFRSTVTSVVWNNVFAYFRTKTKVNRAIEKGGIHLSNIITDEKEIKLTTDGVDFSILKGNADVLRLNKCIALIARGLYYHEFKEPFQGEITYIVIGFLESQFHAMSILRTSFNGLLETYPKKGKNGQVFFYQIIPATEVFCRSQSPEFYQGNGLFFRITFYEGSEFFLILEGRATLE